MQSKFFDLLRQQTLLTFKIQRFMKIRKIYKESSKLEDFSKDRVQINMSWNEWKKIRCFIDFVRWELPQNSRLQKQAQNLNNCIKNAQELEPIWD